MSDARTVGITNGQAIECQKNERGTAMSGTARQGEMTFAVTGREEPMKLIDADDVLSLVDDITGDPGYRDAWQATIRRGIADLPEAVVRCENCIYWDTQDRSTGGVAKCNYQSVARFLSYTDADDFCSHGERRTE